MQHPLRPGMVAKHAGAALGLLAALSGCTVPGPPVASGLPELSGPVQAVRFASMQGALEHRLSGDPLLWRDGQAGVEGSVIPLGTVRSELYGWCRDYEERIAAPGHRYHLVGIACRDPGGTWLVLDLRPVPGGVG